LSFDHKVPDCLYLALAEREGAFLASADRRLLTLTRQRGVDVAVVPSA
jgi:predicted nucleic acid-binding protein